MISGNTKTADRRWHWLRASVVVEGRSLTLYEEVHPRTHMANLQTHRRFIDRLLTRGRCGQGADTRVGHHDRHFVADSAEKRLE